MMHLKPVQGRRRGLSVNSVSDAQQQAMNNSLDNLQGDLTHVETQWNRILNEQSNPLELALSFLDDTSVGLGHRYHDFKQLKTRIGFDLQEAVNEHFQVLNTNVASYGIAVDSITAAQDNIKQLKGQVSESVSNITIGKGSLKELNDNAKKQNDMIDALSSIEYLVQLPEKIEDSIRSQDYKEAQTLLARGFLCAANHDLWSLGPLQVLKQQLELQEHALFNNLVEEIHNIIYTKKGPFSSNRDILKDIGLNQDGFTNLENYLYNVANVDLLRDSMTMNNQLSVFMQKISEASFSLEAMTSSSGQGNEFQRVFFLLSIINDINKLPTALSILTNRAREELHNIVLKCTEEVRTNRPSLLNVAASPNIDDDLGMSVKDVLAVPMKECFWKIFVRFLIAAQGHRVVFESVKKILQSTAINSYKFGQIWSKILNEIETLLLKYLENPQVTSVQAGSNRTSSTVIKPSRSNAPLFTLQHNIEDSSAAKRHANELKALLKDLFPGITISATAELGSIYIEEESFEQEEPLVPPTIFNVKMLLEPYLFFCQATSDLIPTEFEGKYVTSMTFLTTFMSEQFFPKLDKTLAYLFELRVGSNNPYALESIEGSKYIFKAAADFRILLKKLLFIMNTTHKFRSRVFNSLLGLLRKFYRYHLSLFERLFGTAASNVQKRIISVWLTDGDIMKHEKEFLNSGGTDSNAEANLMLRHCADYPNKGGLNKDDILNTVTLNAVIHFLGTANWILSWLPSLRKVVRTPEDMSKKDNIEMLKIEWCFFESNDWTAIDKLGNLKISMDSQAAARFDEILEGFSTLQSNLLTAIRFDTRARCIYHIGFMFHRPETWSSDAGSSELNEHIAALITDLETIENKVRQQQLLEGNTDNVFIGIDSMINKAFLLGMRSVPVINKSGVKRMLRNAKVLQNACQNLVSTPSMVDMTASMQFFSLCGATESDLFRQLDEGKLLISSKNDLKNILRLQFSEDIQRQTRRSSGNPKRVNSMPLIKRYDESVKRLESFGRRP
ncbi:hypothetical protein HG536_0B02390 [Torulaspora globosa]|uniref:Exocyst complex component Sec8 n=1 Tax=Torulaspora globosa TaxID=48254 RepID=A0A7G3ZCZ0_9SACH|nr:uncharacterized protein HG536_0B02390 [Torulaspora globosa]QLL31376.1 hypothetical protein HG536_0B02390 [Torulaspora globosa]